MTRYFRSFFALVTCHPLAWIGNAFALFGAIFTVGYSIIVSVQQIRNPYFGVLFVLMVPPLFGLGMILVPLGIARKIHQIRLTDPELTSTAALQQIWSGVTGTRSLHVPLIVFLVLGFTGCFVTMLILSGGYNYTESTQFCGEVCHTVMEPEFVNHKLSAHSKVTCTHCHVGPGMEWFIRSKIAGTRQLIGVITGHYSKPIPVPVKDLRPSRETCEECHWPEKFHGQRMRVIQRFDLDRENTKRYTALLLRVGDQGNLPGPMGDVHWHVSTKNRVWYISEGDKREIITWVRVDKEGQPPEEYFFTGTQMPKADFQKAEARQMDCVDCHNRPSHVYQMPDEAVDRVLTETPAFQGIPFFKKTAMEMMARKFTEKEIQDGEVGREFSAWYTSRPEFAKLVNAELLERGADLIQMTYRRNVWPRMGIEWGTYPNHISHTFTLGCFRCHSNALRTKSGKSIPSDCRLCHTILALKETQLNVFKEPH